jgi:hypothetical protein
MAGQYSNATGLTAPDSNLEVMAEMTEMYAVTAGTAVAGDGAGSVITRGVGRATGPFFGRLFGRWFSRGTMNVASRITLTEGDAVLAVAHNGKIIAQTSDVLLSHELFVSRYVGKLPAGAEVLTIGKFGGQVNALTSKTFHGTQLPASEAAQAAARAAFK